MTDKRKIYDVLLDLGNVVLDWDVNRVLKSIGASPSEQVLLRTELFGHQDWADMDHGKRAESDVLTDVCTRTPLEKKVVERALLAAKSTLDDIPETVELMGDIHTSGTKMYCLSNMSVETYRYIAGRDFFDLFEGIVISGIEGCMKPQKEIFQLALKRFELKPETTLFIDDSDLNIKAAQSLGINALHFDRSGECYKQIRSLLF